MIRPFDYLVIFVFAYIASLILMMVFFVPMHWIYAIFLGLVLSLMIDLWKLYEKFRVKLEDLIDE